MKALTLIQPWASLVAIGAKRVETRGWRTSYRGPLAIHAAKAFPEWAQDTCYEQPFLRVLLALGVTLGQLPRGYVIATCKLVNVIPTQALVCLSGFSDDYPELATPQELALGDYSEGRWAWILEDINPLPHPLSAKGSLSLWDWEDATNERKEASHAARDLKSA
jgi:hypothetical protein